MNNEYENLFNVPEFLLEIKPEKISEFKEKLFKQIQNNPKLIQRFLQDDDEFENNIIKYLFSKKKNEVINERSLFGTPIKFRITFDDSDLEMTPEAINDIAERILKISGKDVCHPLKSDIKKCVKINLLKQDYPSFESFFDYWKIVDMDTDTEDLTDLFIDLINDSRDLAA